MSWWVKALFVGAIIAAVCAAGGYGLSLLLEGSNWYFLSAVLLALVTTYLVASAIPRRLAPSRTRRSRAPIENAGLHQMAYHLAENPGDGSRARHRFNPDLLVAAIPQLLAIVVIAILA
jgi:hypothetical protein